MGTPHDVFEGEDKLEDYKGLYDEYLPKPDKSKNSSVPSRPGKKEEVKKGDGKSGAVSQTVKKSGVKDKAKNAADPGKTKTVSKDGKAAPPRPQAKNIVKSGDGKIAKKEPSREAKKVNKPGEKKSPAKVAHSQKEQKKVVIEESKERKPNTPLKGNVTANPQSDKKTAKPVAAGKTSP